MHVAGLDGLTLKKPPTLLYVNVTSTGTFDMTISPVNTSRAGIIMAETISGGYSAFFNPYLDGYWTLLNSTVARFTCTYCFNGGRQVEGHLYEMASGKAFEVQQPLSMTAGILGTETTVAPYDYKHAFALPRDTYMCQATGFKFNVYPYSPTQVRWIHVAQAAVTKTGHATVFARA